MQGVGETILWLQVLNVFLSYPITASSYIIDDDKRCLSCLQAMYFVISLVIDSILHCLFRLLTKFVAPKIGIAHTALVPVLSHESTIEPPWQTSNLRY